MTPTDQFELNDLLGDLENGDSFVENYIMGKPEFYREEYDPPVTVAKFNSLPRFGHSGDFSQLLGGSPDDYFLGLLFIGTFICTVFVFWGIAIFVLKCLGPKHVGMLAGFPYREEGKRSVFGRMTLSVSAWMMIVSTIVLITKGLTEMQSLSDTVDMTNYDIQIIEREIQQIVTTLQVVAAKTTPIRDELVDFLKRDICPLEPGSDTEDMVRSVGEDTYDAMVELDDFIEGYLIDVEEGVNQTSQFTTRIENIVGQAQFTNNWKVTAIVFPYFITPAFILVAVCMGWFDVFSEGFYTFITWVIMPLLVILTLAAICASGWMVIFLQANTDLCMPTPEDTILRILHTLNLAPSSEDTSSADQGAGGDFFYDIVVFYSNQCTTENPWEFLEGHYSDLARGKNILGEFIQSIEDTTLGQLSQECGHEYGPIVELLIQLQDLINVLAQTSIRALNLMSCGNIVPLYTRAVYEATCTMGPVGQTWMFSCTVAIAFFGMMAIMFRGAYYPIDYYYYDEKELYPTDDSTNDGMDNHLADNDCNDLVMRVQEDQLNGTRQVMRTEQNHFDVYDDGNKTDDDDDASSDDDDNGYDSLDETTLGQTVTVNGESYSVNTYEIDGDHGYSMNESTDAGSTIQ
eukprot:CAMPEP_0116084042 /NCGR_PEP_ID=MMETSP0327-20121206/3592_1 /TAXON_ID=44447 /ORGANISM="Pseudo-nitzschia delicatissima, Strain B596" /LENGTH=629 /DNA_ID=CAMNT_0003574963 /DNA_START=323 /DNA_END=2212 /DNA_ORIENTATION=-